MTNKQAFDKFCNASRSYVSFNEEEYDHFDLYIRRRKAMSGEDLIFIEQYYEIGYDNDPYIFVSGSVGISKLKNEIVKLMQDSTMFIEPDVAQIANLFPGDDFWLSALKGAYDK